MVDVLVVDDSPFIQTMVEALCEAEGWKVRTAGSVAEGRKAMSECTPRVVMLDYHLPDGYGPELVQEARSIEPPALVVALSMQPRSHVKNRFGNHDVHLVLDKEVVLRSELVDVLREHITRAATEKGPVLPDTAS